VTRILFYRIFILLALAISCAPTSVKAQSGDKAELDLPPQAPPPGKGLPDFNGVWQAPYVPDLSRPLGAQPPFTAFGAEQFKNHLGGDDPSGYCQPDGPTRTIHSPFPFQIVQTAGMTTVLFEIQHTFRRIFTDGRNHPKDPDTSWWGDSVGKYDGDTLRVDTIAMNDKSWLDTADHQHSEKLHVTEVFKKTGPDTIQWTVTYDDPVYFTKPWSISLPLKRQKFDIMEMICTENNRDTPHYITSEKEKGKRPQ